MLRPNAISMTIDKIYINTHRYDLQLTRTCVASVRYWYPDIPVYLIIDYSNGAYPAPGMLRKWDLKILDTGKQHYGWGFGKFEPLFLNNHERFLILDADTVITGSVLEKVKDLDADFVVDKEVQPMEKFISLYYDPVKASEFFPGFSYPGYSFNTGQWIGKSEVLAKSDFNDFVTWSPAPKLKHPEYFKQADQGIFNLLIHLKEKQQQIRVEKIPLMIWPENGNAAFIQFSSIEQRSGGHAPYIIHWAGMKFKTLSEYPRADILLFYEKFFYSRYNFIERILNKLMLIYLKYERKIRFRLKRLAGNKK